MIDLLAVEVPKQVLLSGAMRGLGIGVLAVGMILIYRSCRVINFALGELGALCAALFVRFIVNWHWNFYVALGLMVTVGALLGGVLELVIVRRLYRAPRVVLLVATIGAAQLLLFLQFVLPDITAYVAFPTAFTHQWVVLGDVIVRADHVVALVVFPLLVAGLAYFLNRTRYGVAIRGGGRQLRCRPPLGHQREAHVDDRLVAGRRPGGGRHRAQRAAGRGQRRQHGRARARGADPHPRGRGDRRPWRHCRSRSRPGSASGSSRRSSSTTTPPTRA